MNENEQEKFFRDLLSKIEIIREAHRKIRIGLEYEGEYSISDNLEVINRTVNQIEADLLKLDIPIEFEEESETA